MHSVRHRYRYDKDWLSKPHVLQLFRREWRGRESAGDRLRPRSREFLGLPRGPRGTDHVDEFPHEESVAVRAGWRFVRPERLRFGPAGAKVECGTEGCVTFFDLYWRGLQNSGVTRARNDPRPYFGCESFYLCPPPYALRPPFRPFPSSDGSPPCSTATQP